MKKITVFGHVGHELNLRIAEACAKHGIEAVEYKPLEEGQEPYAIAEGFDPNPPKVTFPYSLSPYLSVLDEIPQIGFDDFAYYPNNGNSHSKYARSATQEELDAPKVGRNEPCPCGSGRKFKKCCKN